MISAADQRLTYCTIPAEDTRRRAAGVGIAVFDVDGVLTDGRVYTGAGADPMLAFHIHDGKGVRMLIDAGITVAWATARGGRAVDARARELGVTTVIDGCSDKAEAVRQITSQHGYEVGACAYTGDDLIDIEAIELAGLGVAVADAHPAVIARADWTTERHGGHGAVREVAELILFSQTRLAKP